MLGQMARHWDIACLSAGVYYRTLLCVLSVASTCDQILPCRVIDRKLTPVHPSFQQFGLSVTYSPFVPFLREAELRNGRTAMLAVLGWIVADFVRIPGEAYSFTAVPHVYQAHDALPESMIQIFGWIALFELVVTAPAIAALNRGEREPGGKFVEAVFVAEDVRVV